MQFNIDNNITNPKSWADWLGCIAKNTPQNQGAKLVFARNKIDYINFKEMKRLSNRKVPVKLLTFNHIIDKTRQIWDNSSLNITDKESILNGMISIHQKRQHRYNQLNFIVRWFAKLRGVEAQLKAERKIIEGLQHKLQTEQQKQTAPILDQKVLTSEEYELEMIHERLKNLWENKKNLKSEEKNSWYEKVFKLEQELFELRQAQSKGESPSFKKKMKELEKELIEKNGEMPRIKHFIKVFGKEELKPTLIETITSLCQKEKIAIKEIEEDRKIFQCNDFEAYALSAKRIIQAKRTDLSLSLIVEIERTWKKFRENQQMAITKKIQDQYVIFDQKDVHLIECYISQGSYKVALGATLFNSFSKNRCNRVILQYFNSDLEKQIKELQQLPNIYDSESDDSTDGSSSKIDTQNLLTTRVTKIASSTSSSSYDSDNSKGKVNLVDSSVKGIDKKAIPSTSDSTSCDNSEDTTKIIVDLPASSFKKINPIMEADKKQEVKISTDKPKEERQKQINHYLTYGQLEGIWPTHEVKMIDGEVAFVQPISGCSIRTNSGKDRVAFSFEDMGFLFRKKELQKKDQVLFSTFIEKFLKGVGNLHARHVMHRDIKPQNILCSQEGEAGLTDLDDICLDEIEIQNEQGKLEKIPNPEKGVIVGSPYFMAPEAYVYPNQCQWKKLNTAMDIWSVGLVLWDSLSSYIVIDHPSFKSSNGSRAKIMRIKENLLTIDAKNYERDYPEPKQRTSLAHIIWRCTRTNPSQRPTIQEIIEHYQRWKNYAIDQLNKGNIQSLSECFEDAVV